MPWRCDLFAEYAKSANLVESAMKRYTEIAGSSEDVASRMKKNVLSWFGHVERMSDERMVKKNYDGKVSSKRGRGRPRLTIENTISKILKEGHVKSMRTPGMYVLRG